jgi:Uma2 family endonuclease
VLEVKQMSDTFQYDLYDWFVALVRAYLEVFPLAKRMALEAGFRLEAADHLSVRKPDFFIVRHDNPVAFGDHDRSYHGTCDLCVESISDATKGEIERDTKTKKREYAAVGVKEYFILDPGGTHTGFFRLNAAGEYEKIEPSHEAVIRSDVLPGFQFRLADLEEQPSLVELAEDAVYQAFVLPEYQAAQARAEQEHARAERFAAKLRELGIDTESL